MPLVKLLSVSFIGASLSGCTVLGVVGDLALNSALEPSNCKSDVNGARDHCGFEPILTQIGLEADIKKAQELLDAAKRKRIEDENYAVHGPDKPEVVACPELKDDKQQCYPADYYKDIYKK